MVIGVDVGGTFTDAVAVRDGELFTAKLPTTPADQSEGALRAIGAVLARSGADAQAVRSLAHGMTVATNALLEGRTARTALVATEGFTDVVELARQARADLYRLCARGPEPLAPPELRFGAPERMGPDGPLRALTEAAADALTEELAAREPEAVAVVLLHSYRHPAHELLLGEALARRLPGVHVSLSHEVVGTFREYERAATTEVDAALSPLLAGYLRRLAERTARAGLPEPAIVQSSGGLASIAEAARHAALTVLSGPAGGAAAAHAVATRAGARDALALDMGGTSCDVCAIEDGRVRETAGRTVGGRPLALPALDIHTVGAGGGSVAWRDAGGALRVGPRSAGADPGPACYGRGGGEPTVTDANLVLGRLGGALGELRLDRVAAERAVAGLARGLDLEPLDCAAGIVRVANAEMARALRVMTVERGIDPRGRPLVAFGGAGPLHAAELAAELELGTVLCPRASGVLSALGLAASERRRDVARSVLLRGDELTAAAIAAVVAELSGRARAELGATGAEIRCRYELRYRGQSFELPVEAGPEPDPGELRAALAAAHRERYGYADEQGEVELVTVRVAACLPAASLEPSAGSGGVREPVARRRVWFGEWTEAAVWSGLPAPGARIAGPAVCELPEATLAVPPGWRGAVDDAGTIALDGPAVAG